MAPAIAHFLVGAGIVLFFATPVAFRYDIDRRWGLWLVPIGGIWGLVPDMHNIAPLFRSQLQAIHYSPWMDLFGLHHLLDRPSIRARYQESVFGSIFFFSLAVGTFSVAQALSGRLEETARDRGLLVAGATLAATGYAGAVVSVLALHLDRYATLAAVVGREGLFAGWLVLAAASLFAGAGLAWSFERLAPRFERSPPVGRLITGGLITLFGWILSSFVAPLWVQYRFGTVIEGATLDWRNLLVIGAFVGIFTLAYSLVRGETKRRSPGR